jgi:hypothetical protein
MNTRHQEILTALFNNPEGLTTVQVLKWCRKQAGSELPDDTGVISKLIYDARAKDWLSSHDTDQGKVHKLTSKGEEELNKDETVFDFLARTTAAQLTDVAPMKDDAFNPIESDGIKQEPEAMDEYTMKYFNVPEVSIEYMVKSLITIQHNLRKLEPRQFEFIDEKLELLRQFAESSFIDQTSANLLRDIADDLRKGA